jgi:hypothetical protein
MKYAVEVTSGGMVYIPSFIKMESVFKILLRWIHIQTHREKGHFISLLLFFQKGKWAKNTYVIYVCNT